MQMVDGDMQLLKGHIPADIKERPSSQILVRPLMSQNPDPTQEQRGVSERVSCPRCKHPIRDHRGGLNGKICTAILTTNSMCCCNLNSVEQGASMESELPPFDVTKEERSLIENMRPMAARNTLIALERLACRERQLLAALNEVQGVKDALGCSGSPDVVMTARLCYEQWDKRIREIGELKAEVSKLSTRIGEIQLAEKVEVEELARVREVVLMYRETRGRIDHARDCRGPAESGVTDDDRCICCRRADELPDQGEK